MGHLGEGPALLPEGHRNRMVGAGEAQQAAHRGHPRQKRDEAWENLCRECGWVRSCLPSVGSRVFLEMSHPREPLLAGATEVDLRAQCPPTREEPGGQLRGQQEEKTAARSPSR